VFFGLGFVRRQFLSTAGFLQLWSGAFTFRGYDCMSFDSFECCTAPSGNSCTPSFSELRFVTCIPTLLYLCWAWYAAYRATSLGSLFPIVRMSLE